MNTMPEQRWSVEFDDVAALYELEVELRSAEVSERRARDLRFGPLLEVRIDYYAGLRIEAYADEHPPPHFHVSCAGGSASFRY